MRLIDLNIGIKLDNNDEVIKLLKEMDADIITLQEVTRGLDNSVFDRYNNSNIIKKNLSNLYQNSFFGALWCAKFHMKKGVITKDFGGLIEQGNEIITKYKIIDAENIFFYKNYAPFVDTTNFRQEDHPRALEKIILEINGQKLQIINLHGIWSEGKKGDFRTLKECEFICKIAKANLLPTIVVGDFNLSSESESIQLMNKHLNNLIKMYNIKTTRPRVKDGLDTGNNVDDYIFINDKIKVNKFEIIKSEVSDHYPLILDFEIIN